MHINTELLLHASLIVMMMNGAGSIMKPVD